MRKMLVKAQTRYTLVVAGIAAWALGVVSVAGATSDPNLTSATTQVTTYFTNNLPVVIGVFIAVALVIWLFAKSVHWVGIRGRVR